MFNVEYACVLAIMNGYFPFFFQKSLAYDR